MSDVLSVSMTAKVARVSLWLHGARGSHICLAILDERAMEEYRAVDAGVGDRGGQPLW